MTAVVSRFADRVCDVEGCEIRHQYHWALWVAPGWAFACPHHYDEAKPPEAKVAYGPYPRRGAA